MERNLRLDVRIANVSKTNAYVRSVGNNRSNFYRDLCRLITFAFDRIRQIYESRFVTRKGKGTDVPYRVLCSNCSNNFLLKLERDPIRSWRSTILTFQLERLRFATYVPHYLHVAVCVEHRDPCTETRGTSEVLWNSSQAQCNLLNSTIVELLIHD